MKPKSYLVHWWQVVIVVLLAANLWLLSVYVAGRPVEYVACPAPGVLVLDGQGEMECYPQNWTELEL